MATNVANQLTNAGENNSAKTQKIVAFPARLMPLHNGHKEVLLDLAKNFDKVIVILGSAYEIGTNNNCVLTADREKTVHAVFQNAGISKTQYEVTSLADMPTFGEWISDIIRLCESRNVTHFCTGNHEDILDVLEKRNEKFDFQIVNPEDYTDFPYHATDIRKMIHQGDYFGLIKLIPEETLPILFRNSFREIIASSQKRAIKFMAGRQTVDLIFLVRDIFDGNLYVLLGKRSMKKKDFPGYLALPGGGIDEFETPINAAVREFKEETGLEVEILDNRFEPAIVKFSNVPNCNLEQLALVGLYSSEDEKLSGTRGGSSQVFGLFVEDDVQKYREYLNPMSDLTDVDFYEFSDAITKGLAYQHEEMIAKAVTMFNAFPNLYKVLETEEKEEKKDTCVIAFVGAPGAGKSTAALGAAYELKKQSLSVEYVQEVAKDLVYNGLLQKYIPNQSYLVSEQYKKLYDVIGKVDYVVTDAGLEICALHSANESKIVEDLAWYLRNKLNQVTIFIERDEENIPYETNGRAESEAESRVFGQQLEKYLQDNHCEYKKVIGSDAAIELALKLIEEREHKN